MAKTRGKKEHNPVFWGEDNSYCYKERLAWITKTLTERYGDVVKSRDLAKELNMSPYAVSKFNKESGLNDNRICMGCFRTEDVARAIVEHI